MRLNARRKCYCRWHRYRRCWARRLHPPKNHWRTCWLHTTEDTEFEHYNRRVGGYAARTTGACACAAALSFSLAMSSKVTIVGADGQPFKPARAQMLAGGGMTPYDAADMVGAQMAAWRPYLASPDNELNLYRDRIVARVRDLVRNDGWASGGVTRILDNAIGANFRPIAKPDYRALAEYSGNPAFNADWADAFRRAVDARWRLWADDPGRYCDAQRRGRMSQLMRLSFR